MGWVGWLYKGDVWGGASESYECCSVFVPRCRHLIKLPLEGGEDKKGNRLWTVEGRDGGMEMVGQWEKVSSWEK